MGFREIQNALEENNYALNALWIARFQKFSAGTLEEMQETIWDRNREASDAIKELSKLQNIIDEKEFIDQLYAVRCEPDKLLIMITNRRQELRRLHEGAKNTEQQVQPDNLCEHYFEPTYVCANTRTIRERRERMEGITIVNSKGNDAFIPLHAIDRITIEPNTEWKMIPAPWYKMPQHDWVKTGKWDLLIETVGRNGGRVVFDTKELAEKKLEDIKAMVPVDLVINKITVKES